MKIVHQSKNAKKKKSPKTNDLVSFRYSHEEMELFNYAVDHSDAKTHSEAVRYAIEFLYKLADRGRYGSKVHIIDELGNTVLRCRITRIEEESGSFLYRKEIKLGSEIVRILKDIMQDVMAFKGASISSVIRAALGWYALALRNLNKSNAVYEVTGSVSREIRVPGRGALHLPQPKSKRGTELDTSGKVVDITVLFDRDVDNNEFIRTALSEIRDESGELANRIQALTTQDTITLADSFLVMGDNCERDRKICAVVVALWFNWANQISDRISSTIGSDRFSRIVQCVLEIRTKYVNKHQKMLEAFLIPSKVASAKEIARSIAYMEESIDGDFNALMRYRLSFCKTFSEAVAVAMEEEVMTLLHKIESQYGVDEAFPEHQFLDEAMTVNIPKQIVRLLVNLPFGSLNHSKELYKNKYKYKTSNINALISFEQYMRDLSIAKMLCQYMKLGRTLTSFITFNSADFHLDMSDWRGGAASVQLSDSRVKEIALGAMKECIEDTPGKLRFNDMTVLVFREGVRVVCLIDELIHDASQQELLATKTYEYAVGE